MCRDLLSRQTSKRRHNSDGAAAPRAPAAAPRSSIRGRLPLSAPRPCSAGGASRAARTNVRSAARRTELGFLGRVTDVRTWSEPQPYRGTSAPPPLPAPRARGSLAMPTPVAVNIYDLNDLNAYSYYMGVGIFHSGLEVHGREYSYGGHDFSSSGIFETAPREAPSPARFRCTAIVGYTSMSPAEVAETVAELGDSFHGRGLHSSTVQLNLSALYGIGGARRGRVARVKGVFRVCRVISCVRHGSS